MRAMEGEQAYPRERVLSEPPMLTGVEPSKPDIIRCVVVLVCVPFAAFFLTRVLQLQYKEPAT